jgi:hypothetical protein
MSIWVLLFVDLCGLLPLLITVSAFTPGGFHVNLNYLFGSARAYHCEAQPGTANRKDRLA